MVLELSTSKRRHVDHSEEPPVEVPTPVLKKLLLLKCIESAVLFKHNSIRKKGFIPKTACILLGKIN
jgi:hypothetical protein